MNENNTNNQSISLGDFLEIFPSASRFLIVVAIIAAAEICISWFVLPAVVPRTVFLEEYLADDFEEVNQRFLDGETYLRPDIDVGWINQPTYSHQNWRTDELGARTTSDNRQPAADSTRILMFGSSRVNGGTFLDFSQTMSGYLEDRGYTVLNFAAMMHTLDQSLIHFNSRLGNVSADVIVVEIDEDTSGLTNVFIPFRVRGETKMPFLKPRMFLKDEHITVSNLPLQSQRTISNLEASLDELKRIDSSYQNFDAYRRLGVLPISSFALRGSDKIGNYVSLFGHSRDEMELQFAILSEFDRIAKNRGALLVAVNFGMYPAGSRKAKIYDAINDSAETIEQTLQTMKIPYIHVPSLLGMTEHSSSDLYFSDGVHLLPQANLVLAIEIARVIEEHD